MDEFVFQDEELPEIEIEQLLSISQMLEFQPSFVAFQDGEMHVMYQQMFGSMRKADSMLKMHKSVLEPKVASLAQHVKPHVLASFKPYEDASFTAEYQAALQAPNYTLQQVGLDAVFLPLVSDVAASAATALLPIRERQPRWCSKGRAGPPPSSCPPTL